MKKSLLTSTLGALALGVAFAAPASAENISACLITKTDTNPFFVKMKEGATEKAKELGIELKSFAGKIDGDHETQVAAIETCIADGAKGILLTASDTSSIVSSVKQARDAGLLVIALDTPFEPIDAADERPERGDQFVRAVVDRRQERVVAMGADGALDAADDLRVELAVEVRQQHADGLGGRGFTLRPTLGSHDGVQRAPFMQ